MAHKGSRKHILDLIDRSDFVETINSILQPYNVIVLDTNTVQPKGLKDDAEYELQFFIDKHNLNQHFPPLSNFNFNKWWNPNGGKAPTWDMVTMCEVNGKKGVLLVEAKAHVGEFDRKPKRLKVNSSQGSVNNHNNIEKRIDKACNSLNISNDGFAIAINKHYQLSNRVTFAWQLSQQKVPVVLFYLGFTGDTYFKDYFEDDSHWEQEFDKYIENVVPKNFINSTTSEFLFIHSALAVQSKNQ